jgi:hypothetical protein
VAIKLGGGDVVVSGGGGQGVVVMNMIGSPKHVVGCLAAGVDIICAQGGEGGGHTGAVSSLALLPQVVDLCRGTGTLVVRARPGSGPGPFFSPPPPSPRARLRPEP